jgi:UDP-N-acetylmuramate dehydrogenase
MSFPDIVPELKAKMPELRGRLLANQSLGEFTWFRVGGPAQAFFMPEDENDLAYFLRNLPPEIPMVVIGAGSNLIVRDGGVPGVVIRLGRGFNDVKIETSRHRRNGDARQQWWRGPAQNAAIAGLAFLSGIPGTIGGALRMNGVAAARPRTFCRSARRRPPGNITTFSNGDMGFSYRHCSVPDDVTFTSAVFQGRAGAPEEIAAEMATIKKKREVSQPRNRTGGSTFKNPPGHSAWKLVDDAGCRGLTIVRRAGVGAAQQFSHQSRWCQRGRYRDAGRDGPRARETHSGVELEWEIKQVGIKA